MSILRIQSLLATRSAIQDGPGVAFPLGALAVEFDEVSFGYDEASSRLSPATERLLDQAIDRLLRGRTDIVIAHRLATVQRADTIMILEEGRVREYGSRADLVTDPDSRLSELLRTGLERVLV